LSPDIVRRLAALPIAALLALVAAAPALAGPAAVTTPANERLLLDTLAPGTVLERHAITGLQPNERIRGIDVRPATGQLYGLGVLATAGDDVGRLYIIDPGTGAATQVGAAPFSTTLTPGEYGFDFNPFNDRARVVNRGEENLRVNADTGELFMQDADLTGAGDVDAIAYDQNAPGSPQTTLWGYDSGVDRVVRIGDVNGTGTGSGNNGVVTFIGPTSGVATGGVAGMDISPGGSALLTASTAGPTYTLFQVDLGAGILLSAGDFSEAVEDIARLRDSTFVLDDRAVTVTEDAGTASVSVLRLGNASGTQTVAYATTDGEAGTSDYLAAAGTLTFGPGETSKTFQVSITNDLTDEPSESLNVALSGPTGGGALGTPSTGTVAIVDDDPGAVTLPPDVTKPVLLLAVPSSLVATTFGRGLKGSLSCSEACNAKLTMKVGKKTVGSRTRKLAAAGKGKFTVNLSKAGKKVVRRALRRNRRLSISLKAGATDAAGNRGTASARVRVTRSR
jgi:hypothetical protein